MGLVFPLFLLNTHTLKKRGERRTEKRGKKKEDGGEERREKERGERGEGERGEELEKGREKKSRKSGRGQRKKGAGREGEEGITRVEKRSEYTDRSLWTCSLVIQGSEKDTGPVSPSRPCSWPCGSAFACP